jgi:hypothetical protein
MAKSPRSLPSHYPQPLATGILKAETYRQASMLRQEIALELLNILAEIKEPAIRARLVKFVESNLAAGMVAARKSRELWPEVDEAQRIIFEKCPKPASAHKNLKLFSNFDDLQQKSLRLLDDSFRNVRLILDRLQSSRPAK